MSDYEDDYYGFQNDYEDEQVFQYDNDVDQGFQYEDDDEQVLQGEFKDYERIALDIGDIGRDATPEDKLKGKINIFVNEYKDLINTYGFITDSESIVKNVKDQNQIKYLNPECLFLAYNSIIGKKINTSNLENVFNFLNEFKETDTDETIYYIQKVDIIRYARFLINQ